MMESFNPEICITPSFCLLPRGSLLSPRWLLWCYIVLTHSHACKPGALAEWVWSMWRPSPGLTLSVEHVWRVNLLLGRGNVPVFCQQYMIFLNKYLTSYNFVFKSLFNLLEFQRLVLNYSPPVKVQDLPRNQKVCPLMSSGERHTPVCIMYFY